MTRLLVVGCGFPQLSLLRAARRRGLVVVGADANPRAVGVAHCDEFFEVSTGDVDGLGSLIAGARIEAVTTTGSEISLRSTALVAERARLPFYADPETVRRCQDKDVMRAAYAAAGLAVPVFARCRTAADALAFAGRTGYPLVVKPVRGSGQRGVARVDDATDLPAAFEDARAHSASLGLPFAVLESWVGGREFSVNGWIEEGQLVSYGVTERLTVAGKRPLGVMVAEVAPAGLTAEDEARIVREAARGASALQHRRGPCYSQLAFDGARCVLFETAARLGGGFDADVARLVSGVDLYDRLLGVALADGALEQQGPSSTSYPAAIAKFLVGRPGVVRAVRGLDEARRIHGVEDAQCFVPVGGRVLPLTDSAKRAAYVLARGADRASAVAAADAALACLRIDAEGLRVDEALA